MCKMQKQPNLFEHMKQRQGARHGGQVMQGLTGETPGGIPSAMRGQQRLGSRE